MQKTLAYRLVFRLDEGDGESYTYNEGFIIIFFNDNKLLYMEGLLTDDYIIVKPDNYDIVFSVYSSYLMNSIYSIDDAYLALTSLDSKVILDLYWEGLISTNEIELPFQCNFSEEYLVDDEESDDDFKEEEDNEMKYITETVQIVATSKILPEDYPKYMERLKEFKEKHVLAQEEWP